MNRLLWLPQYPTIFQPGGTEKIHAIFFKCISWQVEETLDAFNCPYHYVCERTYPENYPVAVDILVLLFTTASYLVTLVIVIMDTISYGRGGVRNNMFLGHNTKRYILPSGPVSLPLIILAFAKGPQINTVFPISCTGPAILHLVLISALYFDNGGADKDFKYAFFSASTVSGILHASLYLDSVVLPYYTGFDAVMSSTFSGECESCVCRKEALVVGGKLVRYRGWSKTTFFVVGVLCLRIVCRILGENNNAGKKLLHVKVVMERFSWILIAVDCVYLTAKSPPERVMLRVSAFGGIFLLILIHVLKEACTQIYTMPCYVAQKMRWISSASL